MCCLFACQFFSNFSGFFFILSVGALLLRFRCWFFVFRCTSLTMMLHSVFNWMSFNVLPSKQCIFRVLLRVFFLLVCFIRPQFTISASVAENSDFVFHHWIKLTSDRLNVRILGSLFRSFFFFFSSSVRLLRINKHSIDFPFQLNNKYYKVKLNTAIDTHSLVAIAIGMYVGLRIY